MKAQPLFRTELLIALLAVSSLSGAVFKNEPERLRGPQVSIIKNYGFLWQRRFIYRGKGHNAGHLNGKRKGLTADFREQIAVYVLYDRNQDIVYVG